MAGAVRILTSGEISLLREVFDQRLTYTKIRLRDGAGLNPIAAIAFRDAGNHAMTWLNTIHFNKGHYRPDFSTDDSGASLLVHEATHVWQYAELGLATFVLRYGKGLAGCSFDQHKMYDYSKDTHFRDATLEGQAQMVGHYFTLRRGSKGDALKQKLARTGFYGL